MIISHKHKFAFFRVPRTGSTTSAVCLRLCGVFDDTLIAAGTHMIELPPVNMPAGVYTKIANAKNDRVLVRHNAWLAGAHWTPTQAMNLGMITLEQLREYNVYAFLREPKDRAVSSYCFCNGTVASPDNMRRQVWKHNFWGIVGVRQSEYFSVLGEQVVEPLDFGDFENELRRIITDLGGELTEIPRINKTEKPTSRTTNADYLDPHTHKVLEARYAADFELYNSMMEKRRDDS